MSFGDDFCLNHCSAYEFMLGVVLGFCVIVNMNLKLEARCKTFILA